MIIKKIKLYGFFNSVWLFYRLMVTKIFYKPAKLIRSPIFLMGRKSISWGQGFTTGVGLRMNALNSDSNKIVICIGDNVQINDYVHIGAINKITIGDNVIIASKVFISDHNHGEYKVMDAKSTPDVIPAMRTLKSKPIHIGDNVWIGELVCILPGVSIGKGSVIGAGSIVTKNVPADCIVAGNPAVIIKEFNKISKLWLPTSEKP